MEILDQITEPILKSLRLEPVETLEEERAIIHWITTSDLDRDNDVIDPKGMDDSEYEQTKTVLFNHNSFYPIGKSGWRKKKEEGVLAKSYFSKTPFANDVYTWHKEGVINAWSVSFMPLLKNGRIAEDAIEYDEKKNLRKFLKWKLLEYSSVPIPANPQAIDMAKSMTKSLEGTQLIDIASVRLDVEAQLKEYASAISEITELKSQLQELLSIKDSFSKLAELEASILELSQEIETKTNEIKIEAKAETLDQNKIDNIIKSVVGEVSRKAR